MKIRPLDVGGWLLLPGGPGEIRTPPPMPIPAGPLVLLHDAGDLDHRSFVGFDSPT
jgi:hypothetical protein